MNNIRSFLKRRSVVELILLTELFAFLMFIIFVFATDGAPLRPEFDYVFGAAFLLILFGSPFVWIAYGALRHKREIRAIARSGVPVTAPVGKGGSSAVGGILVLVALVMIFWGTSFVAIWLFPESPWAYKWNYFYDKELEGATISIDHMPHDCDFFTAPLGSKNCHFEKNLLSVRIRTDGPQRLVSVDEGKTWKTASPSDRAAVYISWAKVLD